mmetsp:Transcript_25538/g.55325  ORF Transcript_25538/g.55325 Transcript_25538/m.55325 type:complete len:93 (+) Transcript_25538:95-373(+)
MTPRDLADPSVLGFDTSGYVPPPFAEPIRIGAPIAKPAPPPPPTFRPKSSEETGNLGQRRVVFRRAADKEAEDGPGAPVLMSRPLTASAAGR